MLPRLETKPPNVDDYRLLRPSQLGVLTVSAVWR